MMGNYHVRFLGGEEGRKPLALPGPYIRINMGDDAVESNAL
jgi:hypothetical protein